jgi:hypothetical protein
MIKAPQGLKGRISPFRKVTIHSIPAGFRMSATNRKEIKRDLLSCHAEIRPGMTAKFTLNLPLPSRERLSEGLILGMAFHKEHRSKYSVAGGFETRPLLFYEMTVIYDEY